MAHTYPRQPAASTMAPLRASNNTKRPSHSSTSSSHIPSSSFPIDQNSMCNQMSHSFPCSCDFNLDSGTSSQTSNYLTTHTTSSAQSATSSQTHNVDSQVPMENFGMDSSIGGFGDSNMWNMVGSENPFGDDIPNTINISTWLAPFGPGSAPYVATYASDRTAKTELANVIDDLVKHINPEPVPHAPESIPHATNKRRRLNDPLLSNTGEDDQQALSTKRRLGSSSNLGRSNPHPTYPRAIPHEIRELTDEDFENSCEWCPFYLHEPFQYFNKPWSSCTKQRAEVSHIVTHVVSDHGLIRGNNSKRVSQRYITRCSSHNSHAKGKAGCTLCPQVELWTEEELADKRHDGPSLCLRCYEVLPTKRDLFNHLQEASLCMYKEDWPMRRKSRILYTVFCSSQEVPKFRPPPETTAPRDGARKRNLHLKTVRRTSTEPTGIPSNGPSSTRQRLAPIQRNAHLSPTLSISLSPSISPLSPTPPQGPKFSDVSGHQYPPMSATHQMETMETMLSPHQVQFTQFPSCISREPVPSYYSELDGLELMTSYPIQLPQSNSLSPEFLQPSIEGQATGQPAQKHPAHDSGLGSDMGGDPYRPLAEEECSFPSGDLDYSEMTYFLEWTQPINNINMSMRNGPSHYE